MQVTVEKIYNLAITEQELTWLTGIMQNPLFCEYPEDEDSYTKEMRSTFWYGLNNIEGTINEKTGSSRRLY